MMRAEGVTEKGHLQINRNVIRNLTDLHADLLASTKYPFYNAAYFRRCLFYCGIAAKERTNGKNPNWRPVLIRFTAYCCCVCRKRFSLGTAKAIEAISSFLSCLPIITTKKGELKLDND